MSCIFKKNVSLLKHEWLKRKPGFQPVFIFSACTDMISSLIYPRLNKYFFPFFFFFYTEDGGGVCET